MPGIADINVRIGAEIKQFQAGLRQAERELQRSADKFNQLGNNLSVSVTLPIIAASAAAFQFGKDFQTTITKIDNLTEISDDNLKKLTASIKGLANDVGQGPNKLAEAAYFIEGAGLAGAEGLKELEQSAKATAIGLGSQTDVAKIAGAAVKAYGEDVAGAGIAIDQLLQIAREGNAEPAELAASLGTVLPIAAKLKVSFAEVGASVATFTRLGVGTSTAVDGLKSALGNLLKPSEQAVDTLASVGLTAQDVRDSIAKNGLASTLQSLVKAFNGNDEAISRVFGDVQGLTAVLATAEIQGDDYAKSLRNIQNSAGEVDKAFEKTSQTAEFKLQKSIAGLQTAAVNFGGTFLPIVTDLLSAVNPLIDGFANLNPEVQKVIVGFGLAAAAAGPLFKLIGGSIEIYKTASSAIKSFGKAAETSQAYFTQLAPAVGNLKAGLGAAATAWRALDTVAKATVIGAALAVVIALGAAFYSMSESMSAAGRAQAAVNAVQVEAQKNIAAERLEAEALVATITDSNAKYSDKETALKRLNQISPEYFGGLKIEEGNYNAINAALGRYVDSLLKAAQIKAAEGKIVELEKRKLDLLQAQAKVQEKSQGRLLAETLTGVVAPGAALSGGFGQIGSITAELKKIDAEQKALANIAFTANSANAALKQQAVATAGAPLGLGGAPLSDGKKDKTKKADTFEFKDVAAGLLVINDQAYQTNGILEKLGGTTLPVVSEANNSWATAMAYTARVSGEVLDTYAQQEETLTRMATIMTTVASAGQAVGDAIFQASADGAASLQDLAKAGANAARAFIAQQIAMGVAAQVRTALGTGLAGLLLAPIAGAAAAALFNKLIPKFADGGIVTGPTYGLVGEAGPEVIFPLKDLKKFMGTNGGGGAVQVYGRLSGTDILLSSERSDVRRMKARGY